MGTCSTASGNCTNAKGKILESKNSSESQTCTPVRWGLHTLDYTSFLMHFSINHWLKLYGERHQNQWDRA